MKLPGIATTFRKNVETDLSLPQLLWLAKAGREVELENIKLGVIPTRSTLIERISYQEPDVEATRRLAGKIREKVAFREELDKASARIAVLNGTQFPGKATKVAEKLRALGYQVVKVSKAEERSYEATKVFALGEAMKCARALAREIDCDPVQERFSTAVSEPDIFVIVGADVDVKILGGAQEGPEE